MTVAKQMDIRKNIKYYFDLAFSGDAVFVPRKNNKNVYVISQAEYEELQKAKQNAEYLAKIDRSYDQLRQGKTISFSIEELQDMESDDWKPTKKIVDFMEKMTNE